MHTRGGRAKTRQRFWLLATGILLFCMVTGYVATMLLLPAPQPIITQKIQSGPIDTGVAPAIDWPNGRQVAVGAVGRGVIVAHGDEKPQPTASIAKVIAALAILKQKPLETGQSGPTITLTSADVAIYTSYVAQNGSVVPVEAGERLSEYQALQAMLIPSANNIATSATTWVFGSEAAYVAYANTMLAEMGLKSTHVADASGFSPGTVSTAKELVLLGQAAMQQPVIAGIVGQREATLPVAGKVVTTNTVMGKAGISGIKTGHTAQSGGCFLFAATRNVGDAPVTVVAAIMAAPSIDDARNAAPGVIEEGFSGFRQVTGLDSGAVVATVSVPWAQPAYIVADEAIKQVVWAGDVATLEVGALKPTRAAGTARFGDATTTLSLSAELPQPDAWWRLTHPVDMFAGLR